MQLMSELLYVEGNVKLMEQNGETSLVNITFAEDLVP